MGGNTELHRWAQKLAFQVNIIVDVSRPCSAAYSLDCNARLKQHCEIMIPSLDEVRRLCALLTQMALAKQRWLTYMSTEYRMNRENLFTINN